MADPLKVECPHCGGSLKLKDRSAEGKKVRCPKCEETFKVELPPEDIDDLDDIDDFDDMDASDDAYQDDEYQDEAPRKKSKAGASKKTSKKKSKSSRGNSMLPLMIGAIALGGIAVVGLLVFVVMNFAGSGNKINMAYLFPDSDIVVRVKLAEVLNAPLLAGVMNTPAVKAALNKGVGAGDVQITDIDSVTVGMSSKSMKQAKPFGGTPEGTVVVVRSKKPFDMAKTAGILNLKEATHNGKKYYMPAFGKDGQYAPDAYTLIVAGETDLKRVIEQGGSQIRRKEFDFVDANHQIVFAAVPQSPDGFNLTPGTMPGTGPGAATFQQFQKSLNETGKGFSAGIDITDGISIAGKLNCKDDGGAGALKGQLDTILAEAKAMVANAVKNLPPGNADVQQMAQMGQQTIESISVSQEQSNLVVKMAVPNSLKTVIDKAVANPFFAMAMMGALNAGGGMGGPPAGGFGGPGAMPPGTQPSGTIQPGQLPPGFADPAGGNFPMPGTNPMPGAFPMPGTGPIPGTNPMPMPPGFLAPMKQ